MDPPRKCGLICLLPASSTTLKESCAEALLLTQSGSVNGDVPSEPRNLQDDLESVEICK